MMVRAFNTEYILILKKLVCSIMNVPFSILIAFWLLDCSDGQIQLVGGSNDAEGTIEICFGSLWGAISATTWTNANTQVTCRQLGFAGNHMCNGNIMASKQDIYDTMEIRFYLLFLEWLLAILFQKLCF